MRMAKAQQLWSFLCLHVILLLQPCTTKAWTSTSAIPLAAVATGTAVGNDTDQISLLAFKTGIAADPTGLLSSWNSSLPFCHWGGVRCGRRHSTRVVGLYLDSLSLFGSISPSLANLTFLRELHLHNNSLYGVIPHGFGHLVRLRLLDLSSNSLGGDIPSNLTRCLQLRKINLSHNRLTGQIPAWLSSLPQLLGFNLMDNQLHGSVPASLGNLSSHSFQALSIGQNNLTGAIPEGLGRLDGLVIFDVHENHLSGTVPTQLYNKSSLFYLGLATNQLSGSIPSHVGTTLPMLTYFYVYENHFQGLFPDSLSNCSLLEWLDLSLNDFHGKILANLGRLKNLLQLNVGGNRFQAKDPTDWDFLTSLTNCTRLTELSFDLNLLEGLLPDSMANLPTSLTVLTMGNNMISGEIPRGIENLTNLRMLRISYNRFTGNIPASLGKLSSLGRLGLEHNFLSGEIPSTLGNLSRLSELYLSENQLSGSIPTSFGRLQQLQNLNISLNNMSGTIPDELFTLPSLSKFLDLSHNSLEGPIPMKAGSLSSLGKLYLSHNRLSGEIPSSLGDCLSLEVLNLNHNLFRGNIPPSLGNLKGLQSLDLSVNNLTGGIPNSLGDLKFLSFLNLSFNNLQGEVPKNGIFAYASAISLVGNDRLCGGPSSLKLPACPLEEHGEKGHSHLLKVIIPTATAGSCLLLVSLCLTAYVLGKKRSETRPTLASSWEDKYERISYDELHKGTGGFSTTNLIGTGSFGAVYRGSLDGGQRIVAVKVLNLQQRGAEKSFLAECEALKSVRHRNLVKIISSCSSMDFKGNDFKALVYEFMPHGSLEDWLHPRADVHGRWMGFAQRLSIATDVASALEYLHKHCPSPIVHCDLKPSNVLLDNDMNARLSDFGLARILLEAKSIGPQNPTSSIGLKGSIGYVAPDLRNTLENFCANFLLFVRDVDDILPLKPIEYGLGVSVTTQGDVYSFGVLLLEMFTAKKPIDGMFKDGLSLRKFVEMAVPDQVMRIVEPRLLVQGGGGGEGPHDRHDGRHESYEERMRECLVYIMGIGLMCTRESPRERMEMEDVVKELHKIKDIYVGTAKGIGR